MSEYSFAERDTRGGIVCVSTCGAYVKGDLDFPPSLIGRAATRLDRASSGQVRRRSCHQIGIDLADPRPGLIQEDAWRAFVREARAGSAIKKS